MSELSERHLRLQVLFGRLFQGDIPSVSESTYFKSGPASFFFFVFFWWSYLQKFVFFASELFLSEVSPDSILESVYIVEILGESQLSSISIL